MILVEILEDIFTELFYLIDYIPSLVILDVFVYVVTDPFQHFFSLLQAVDHFIYGLCFHLVVVEVDAEVGRQIELVRKVAQHRLEESVNRLYTELIIMVGKQGERFSCMLTDGRLRESGLFHDLVEVRLRIGKAMGDAIELR